MRRNHKEKKRLLSQAALARSSSLRVKTPSFFRLQTPDIPPGRMPTGREKVQKRPRFRSRSLELANKSLIGGMVATLARAFDL